MTHSKFSFWFFLALILPTFMVGVDLTILGVGLPVMASKLHVTLTTVQWFITAYAIGYAAAVIIIGRMSDIYGKKKLLLWSIVIFTLASLIIALSNSALLITIMRLIQGVFAGGLAIGAIGIISHVFSPEERATYIAIPVAAAGAGMAVAPLIGGYLINQFGWPSIFLINVPIGIIDLFLVIFAIKVKFECIEDKLDLIGSALIAASMVCFTLFITQGSAWGWTSGLTLSFLVIAIVLMLIFIVVESKVSDPLITFNLFKIKNYSPAVLATMLVYFSLTSFIYLFGIYLQRVYGMSSTQTGLALLPFAIMWAVGGTIAGRLMGKIDAYRLTVICFILGALSILALSMMHTQTHFWKLAIYFAVFGLCFSLVVSTTTKIAMHFIEKTKAGLAAGTMQMLRWIGAALGTAITAAIFTNSAVSNVTEKLISLHYTTMLDSFQDVVRGKEPLSHLTGQLSNAAAPQATDLINQAYTHGLHVALATLFVLLVISFIFFISSVKRK